MGSARTRPCTTCGRVEVRGKGPGAGLPAARVILTRRRRGPRTTGGCRGREPGRARPLRRCHASSSLSTTTNRAIFPSSLYVFFSCSSRVRSCHIRDAPHLDNGSSPSAVQAASDTAAATDMGRPPPNHLSIPPFSCIAARLECVSTLVAPQS